MMCKENFSSPVQVNMVAICKLVFVFFGLIAFSKYLRLKNCNCWWNTVYFEGYAYCVRLDLPTLVCF
jgi:hypothetical protein